MIEPAQEQVCNYFQGKTTVYITDRKWHKEAEEWAGVKLVGAQVQNK